MNKKFSLNGNQLKLLAMAVMLIDHFAYVMIEKGIFAETLTRSQALSWYEIDRIMRSIGRIAFPIFCFMIVEGFQKTRDAGRYLKRLLLFALVSEIPFDLALRGKLFAPDYQNVFWTLSFGLAAMMIDSRRELAVWKRIAGFSLCMILPFLLHTDYSFYGVLAIFMMYQMREKSFLLMSLASLAILTTQNLSEIWAIFGFVFLYFYNGERGKGNKYLFYAFYPVHLLILYALRPILTGMMMNIFR